MLINYGTWYKGTEDATNPGGSAIRNISFVGDPIPFNKHLPNSHERIVVLLWRFPTANVPSERKD
jgi:hypothetical protein